MTGTGRAGAAGGLVAGAAVAAVVAGLLHRLARLGGEIERYTAEIARSAEGICDHLGRLDQLARTGELAERLTVLVPPVPEEVR